ncbi:MAG: signal recognition particle protein, partial [Anaerolineaceae bacterium]
IKFLGIGEGIDAIEVYEPSRLASRILGMGDVLGLIEKAEAAFDEEESKQQAGKMMNGKFTLEDFANQLKQVKKMGPLSQILDMLPGSIGQAAKMVDPKDAENQLKKTEAIINSMTMQERRNPDILNANRRRRIARGCGLEVQDVNRLMKQFRDTQRLMKTLQSSGGKGLSRLFG